jgi:hypothetical protein
MILQPKGFSTRASLPNGHLNSIGNAQARHHAQGAEANADIDPLPSAKQGEFLWFYTGEEIHKPNSSTTKDTKEHEGSPTTKMILQVFFV